jgi:hypothetical protein
MALALEVWFRYEVMARAMEVWLQYGKYSSKKGGMAPVKEVWLSI